jgi:hypothetical protein
MPRIASFTSSRLTGIVANIPAPDVSSTYSSLTLDNTAYDEGDTIIVALNSTNIPNGTTVGYTVTGMSFGDLVSGATTGTFTINSNIAFREFVLNNDGLTEGPDTFTITLAAADSAGRSTGSLSASATVNDTSNNPASSIWVDDNGNPVTVRTIIGANSLQLNGVFAANPSVPRTIEGRSSAAQTTITAVTARTGTFIELDDTGNSTSFIVGESLNLVTISYSVAPAANNINEGSGLTFTVTTANLPNGITLYWTVSRPEDFAASSGSFTINNNTATFTVTPTADTTTEGAETFTASVRTGSTSGTVVATSSSVTINDTSLTQPPVASSTRAFTVAQSTSLGLFTTDGITWTETTLPSSGIWLDSNYNPASVGRACALRWGAAAYSTDYGQTWLAATGMGGGDGSVSSLAPVTSTVWITVGSFPPTQNYYRSTDNGQTWTLQNFGFTYNGEAVAGAGAGLAVIVTGSLTYYTTTDGLAFTTRTFPSNPDGVASGWNEIEYVNGLYIAMRSVQNGRYIMTSSDGINWTVRDVSAGVSTLSSFRDISFGGAEPGTWLIVTDTSDVYFTSTDLVTWTRRTLPASRRWSGITWINNRWVAIVDGTNIKATSTDGVNWTESALTSADRRWMDLTEVR